jgi:ribosomal protein L7/L12
MVSNRFRDVAKALQPYVSDTYDLLNAVDAVLSLDAPESPWTAVMPKWDANLNRWEYPHNALVDLALANTEVMEGMYDGKKIQAIKALRTASGCGLKAAKDACEDARISERVQQKSLDDLRAKLAGDPWATPECDSYDVYDEEPPF